MIKFNYKILINFIIKVISIYYKNCKKLINKFKIKIYLVNIILFFKIITKYKKIF